MSSVGLTGTGQYVGTPDYIAPEQINGKPVDGRTDQYGLACAAFELLTGQPPFRRDDPAAVIWAHLSVQPPLVASLRPDLPAAADAVFARALAKDPGDRYTDCLDFAEALRASLGLSRYSGAHAMASAQPPDADRPATVIANEGDPAPHVPALAESADRSVEGSGGPATMTSAPIPAASGPDNESTNQSAKNENLRDALSRR